MHTENWTSDKLNSKGELEKRHKIQRNLEYWQEASLPNTEYLFRSKLSQWEVTHGKDNLIHSTSESGTAVHLDSKFRIQRLQTATVDWRPNTDKGIYLEIQTKTPIDFEENCPTGKFSVSSQKAGSSKKVAMTFLSQDNAVTKVDSKEKEPWTFCQ